VVGLQQIIWTAFSNFPFWRHSRLPFYPTPQILAKPFVTLFALQNSIAVKFHHSHTNDVARGHISTQHSYLYNVYLPTRTNYIMISVMPLQYDASGIKNVIFVSQCDVIGSTFEKKLLDGLCITLELIA
jgi:hypothetical protein